MVTHVTTGGFLFHRMCVTWMKRRWIANNCCHLLSINNNEKQRKTGFIICGLLRIKKGFQETSSVWALSVPLVYPGPLLFAWLVSEQRRWALLHWPPSASNSATGLHCIEILYYWRLLLNIYILSEGQHVLLDWRQLIGWQLLFSKSFLLLPRMELIGNEFN